VKKRLFTLFVFFSFFAKAQTPLAIPDTISGLSINLNISDSVHQFYAGYNTSTIGFNGSYLGPTIILNKGQAVTMNVKNQLTDSTTVHWHGLHVAPMNDGSPHSPILPAATWSPNFTVMDNAGLYWYHPHLHMKTFQQVVKGAAGLIIVRDSIESSLMLPRTYGVDDIPLVCQFKTINTTSKQFMMSDSMDNVVMVNGVIDPYVNSPAQVVRYRILNGSSMRVFRFGFNDNRIFYQITSDDGLLNAPVSLTRLTLGPGERAEILVNLSGDLGNTIYVKTFGNELPQGYPGGAIGMMMCGTLGPLDNISFNVLRINVVAQTANPVTTVPATLASNTAWSTTGASTRNFTLATVPMMSCNFFINSTAYNASVNNFAVQQDKIEIWDIQNSTSIAHPFHIHGNHFYILTRNGSAPPLNERGRKDVILIGPQETVRVITKYETFCDSTMPFMYHCHILKHEDMGMMGQFIVKCSNTGVIETENEEMISMFPNPSDGFFTISATKKITKIEITDVIGNVIYQTPINNFEATIDLSENAKGVYFVKVFHNEESSMQKAVIR
jgi:bilirubin oxidase